MYHHHLRLLGGMAGMCAALGCGGDEDADPTFLPNQDAGRIDASDAGSGGATDAQASDATDAQTADATDGTSPDSGDSAGGIDGADTGTTSDGGGVCPNGIAKGILLDAAALKQESISQLRAFLGLTNGLDNGKLYFRDGVTSVGQCPAYDQSSVVYSVPISSTLVPEEILKQPSWSGKAPRINFNWGLNGYRYIHFNNENFSVDLYQAWNDYLPIAACATLTDTVDSTRAAQMRDEMKAVAGEVPVDLFPTIGVICWGPHLGDTFAQNLDGSGHGYLLHVNDIADIARGFPGSEVAAIEWSNLNYGLDWALSLAVQIDQSQFYPECLRTESAKYSPTHPNPIGILNSFPSFPPPFGPGWKDNPSAGDCP